MVSVALIDVIGLTYDGDTLKKRGLGGSESAIILMSRELAALGFDVTVFNNCIDKEAAEGTYDGVKYIDLSMLRKFKNYSFDVVISSRTVFPFLKPRDYPQFMNRFDVSLFDDIKQNAKHKVVWLHDTFCQGDHLLEQMLVDGDIDDVFTLSDFHTSYITTCNHGNKRMLEVMKRKLFMTRNGATLYPGEVDITAKDKNLFVYNASVTKGMLPLVNHIWPMVKARIPDAKLKVIGGYYRFRENAAPDEQEKTWRAMVNDPKFAALDVEFTGIIKQSEIAEILKTASYTIFPPAFPETFGISSLESLLYNTPLLTSRFGALEETAVEQASYFIDYAIEPNGLYPFINSNEQNIKFANMVVAAYNNPYLHQQKMQYCNIVKGIHGWDSVALQWKQHLYHKLGLYLPVDDYRKVSFINARVRDVYGRRFSNPVDVYYPRQSRQQKIVVVTPAYNAEQWIAKCIESVATQDYDNWEMHIIDDCSTDNTTNVAVLTAERLGLTNQIHVTRNTENKGAVFNQVSTIRRQCEDDDIIMLIDGDDSLVNNNQIFHMYNNMYYDYGVEFTYGSMWSMVDDIPLVAQPYPEQIKKDRAYRTYRFAWNMPYTHLRTFRKFLIDGVDDTNFKDDNGNWFKAGGDGAVFYTLIEQADPNAVRAVPDIVYNYNDTHDFNDYKVNGGEQTRNAQAILNRGKTASSRVTVPTSGTKASTDAFSVVIPTMWRANDVMKQLLSVLTNHKMVNEITVINNDIAATPYDDMPELGHPKVRIMATGGNLMVNPSWNVGVKVSVNDYVAIINDDIVFDGRALDVAKDLLSRNQFGVIGMIAGEKEFGQPTPTNFNIDVTEWKRGDNLHGFGQAMFMKRSNWVDINDNIKIYFGDDVIIHNQLIANRKVGMMHNIIQHSPRASTTKDESITAGMYAKDKQVFDEWFHDHPLTTINEGKMKTILIAVPTNKYIEPETMKSIYDLKIPDGYTTTFQYFFGYNVDQIRNLIADWATRFDYLFAVDADMSFAPDTLERLLSHDKDVVSGLYIQRKPGQHILEIYRNGRNVPYSDIKGKGLVEIDGCGFGCVLVKSKVIKAIGYPQFVYKSALDHAYTVSEDTYFCSKAIQLGFKVWADTTIKCGHHGANVFYVDDSIGASAPVVQDPIAHLKDIADKRMLPMPHRQYLEKLGADGVNPSVVYDLGSCVLHWAREAATVWPAASVFAIEAMAEVEPIYNMIGLPPSNYHFGVLSDTDGKEITFYKNVNNPAGNSYYRENAEINKDADALFTSEQATKAITTSLDTIMEQRNWPLPDLIKMDIQGAEMDVLKGASKALSHCDNLILELQHVEYNKGAPLQDEVIEYLKTIGFELVGMFCDNGPDGDFHFRKVK